MKKLIRRAKRVYRSEGTVSVVEKSARFIPRYIRHVLGTKGLYGTQWYQKLLLWWNSRPHTAVADPFKTIYIDPTEISQVTGRGPNPGRFQWQDIGKVQGGEWDQRGECIEELPVVRALRKRFEGDKDWEDIGFVQYVIEQAERGHVIWRGCESENDVWEACARVDRLYERIQEHGYQKKQEVIHKEGLHSDKYVAGDGFNQYDEVLVDIGRDGEFLFVDGRHRLAIARILELDEIPVRISARHKQWQQVREIVAKKSRSKLPEYIEQHLTHPDLTDVLDESERGK